MRLCQVVPCAPIFTSLCLKYPAVILNKQQIDMVIIIEKLNGALAGSIDLFFETIATYMKQEENANVTHIQDAGPSSTRIVASMAISSLRFDCEAAPAM